MTVTHWHLERNTCVLTIEQGPHAIEITASSPQIHLDELIPSNASCSRELVALRGVLTVIQDVIAAEQRNLTTAINTADDARIEASM